MKRFACSFTIAIVLLLSVWLTACSKEPHVEAEASSVPEYQYKVITIPFALEALSSVTEFCSVREAVNNIRSRVSIYLAE